MAEEKGEAVAPAPAPAPPPRISPHYDDDDDVNAKWDACADLSIRRVFYSTLSGAFVGLLLFRSPVAKWSSLAFAAGIGVGSAYSDCSHKFGGSPSTLMPKASEAPLSEDVED